MRLSPSDTAMPPRVRAEQGATSMPWTAKEPLAIGAAISRNECRTSANASTPAGVKAVSSEIVRAPAGEITRCVS